MAGPPVLFRRGYTREFSAGKRPSLAEQPPQ
jgi:hypothetical protein